MTVVVAALLKKGDRYFVQTRPEGKHMAGKWEFPGGKLEKGESPEAALERELWEELGVRTKTGRIRRVVNHSYPEKDILLLFFESALLEGAPAPLEGQQTAWLLPAEMTEAAFAPADRPMVAALRG